MNPRHLSLDGNRLYINSSSLALLQSCPKKADYIFNLGAEPKESAAMTFGTRIHSAMEEFYKTPVSGRTPNMLPEIMSRAMEGFLSIDDKRTAETAIKMAKHYEESFSQDQWEVLSDEHGPIVEREFKMFLVATATREIWWFGKIDMAVKSVVTGEIAIMDHKTTSSVGADFFSRWNPNHQITGYLLGLGHILNLEAPPQTAIINGLQVVKTKQNAVRIETRRTPEEFAEFKRVVLYYVGNYLCSMKAQFFPKVGGYACSSYGGCQFIDACKGLIDPKNLTIKNY